MGALGFVVALLAVWDFAHEMMIDSNVFVKIGAGMVVFGALVLLVTIIREFWLAEFRE